MMTQQGKRKSLGRGLSALLGDDLPEESPAAASQRDGRTLPVEYLQTGEFQPRRHFDPEALQALVQSVREKGVLEPILVRQLNGQQDRYEIIAGERRWRAAQTAGLHEVPVIVKELDDQEALEIALIENLQREDLTAIEEAEGYRRLMDQFARTQEDLAREIGKSRSHVANTMRLLALPEEVRDQVQDGQLSAGHARALLGAENPGAAAAAVIKKALNVRQTEAMIRRERDGGQTTGARRTADTDKDTNTVALERDIGNLLGLKVEIDERGESGTLKLHYRSLEQLDDVLQRITGGENS
jgi:ParB family transcriptional regulator, chromosome partitioning protein